MKRFSVYLVLLEVGMSCVAISVDNGVTHEQTNILQIITTAIEKEIAGANTLFEIMLNAPRQSVLSEKLIDAIEKNAVTESLVHEIACDRLSPQDVRVIIGYAMKMHKPDLAAMLLDNLMGQLDQMQKNILLFDAIRMGTTEIVIRLLAAGANFPESTIFLNRKDLALAIALYRGEYEMAQELLHWSSMKHQVFSSLMISAAIDYAEEHNIPGIIYDLREYERIHFTTPQTEL